MIQLLGMASKKAVDLSDQDLESVATALLGKSKDTSGLLGLFKALRDAEPEAKINDLLSTPSANEMLKNAVAALKSKTEKAENGFYCRCPNCNFPFVYELD